MPKKKAPSLDEQLDAMNVARGKAERDEAAVHEKIRAENRSQTKADEALFAAAARIRSAIECNPKDPKDFINHLHDSLVGVSLFDRDLKDQWKAMTEEQHEAFRRKHTAARDVCSLTEEKIIEAYNVSRAIIEKAIAGKLKKPDLLPCIGPDPASAVRVRKFILAFVKAQETRALRPFDLPIAAPQTMPAVQLGALELIPAAVSYRGKIRDLVGRDRQLLNAILQSRFRRCTVNELMDAMEISIGTTENGEQIVKMAAGHVRAILKEIIAESGETCENPLLSKGNGKDLTYILNMP